MHLRLPLKGRPLGHAVTIERLPVSILPNDLEQRLGSKDSGSGERLIPGHIEERFELDAKGELVAVTAGPLTMVQKYSGIVAVLLAGIFTLTPQVYSWRVPQLDRAQEPRFASR